MNNSNQSKSLTSSNPPSQNGLLSHNFKKTVSSTSNNNSLLSKPILPSSSRSFSSSSNNNYTTSSYYTPSSSTLNLSFPTKRSFSSSSSSSSTSSNPPKLVSSYKAYKDSRDESLLDNEIDDEFNNYSKTNKEIEIPIYKLREYDEIIKQKFPYFSPYKTDQNELKIIKNIIEKEEEKKKNSSSSTTNSIPSNTNSILSKLYHNDEQLQKYKSNEEKLKDLIEPSMKHFHKDMELKELNEKKSKIFDIKNDDTVLIGENNFIHMNKIYENASKINNTNINNKNNEKLIIKNEDNNKINNIKKENNKNDNDLLLNIDNLLKKKSIKTNEITNHYSNELLAKFDKLEKKEYIENKKDTSFTTGFTLNKCLKCTTCQIIYDNNNNSLSNGLINKCIFSKHQLIPVTNCIKKFFVCNLCNKKDFFIFDSTNKINEKISYIPHFICQCGGNNWRPANRTNSTTFKTEIEKENPLVTSASDWNSNSSKEKLLLNSRVSMLDNK